MQPYLISYYVELLEGVVRHPAILICRRACTIGISFAACSVSSRCYTIAAGDNELGLCTNEFIMSQIRHQKAESHPSRWIMRCSLIERRDRHGISRLYSQSEQTRVFEIFGCSISYQTAGSPDTWNLHCHEYTAAGCGSVDTIMFELDESMEFMDGSSFQVVGWSIRMQIPGYDEGKYCVKRRTILVPFDKSKL